jgi:WD40 repeat protein/serine/threonine protein kinase
MALMTTCECGHRWELASGTPDAAGKISAVCPACGKVNSVQEPHSSGATATFLPDQLPDVPETVTGSPKPQTPSHSSDRLAVPGYEILKELGRGGMGVVYKARHKKLNRIVALKMILVGGHAGKAELGRFKTEAEIIARLQHPNIIQIHEVGEHDGRPFFSLEFCGGGSLDRRLQGTPLPPREAARLVEKLARAMSVAHEARVIHRDLKPANILLSLDVSPRQAASKADVLQNVTCKITDFGLAKQLDDVGQTQTGAIMGTPSYMAPEQAEGKKKVEPLADVYALGAILYECLTGRPPFKAATSLDTIMQVVADEPVPPRQLQSKVPRDLETICLKCLRKDPRKRYASALLLADDLRRFGEGKPINARRVGAFGRLSRWCARNPTVAALTATVAISLMAGTGIASYFAVQARNRAKDADESANQAREEKYLAFRRAYVADMRLAQRAWEEGQIGRVLELLHGQRPEETGDLDLRGFEWFYWQRRCRSDLLTLKARTLPSQPDSFSRVVFGHQGSRLYTIRPGKWGPPSLGPGRELTSTPTLVRECDAHTGKELRSWQFATGGVLYYQCAVLSPDCRRLACVSNSNNVVRVWDLAENRQIWQSPIRLPSILCLAFSQDGCRLAIAGGDNTFPPPPVPSELKIWDLDTGKLVHSLPGHPKPVCSVVFSADGALLASASEDGTLKIWDSKRGKEQLSRPGLFGASPTLVFHPESRRLAGMSHGNLPGAAGITLPTILDASTGQRLLVLHNAQSPITFSPDGRWLASAAGGGQLGGVKVWDADTGAEKWSFRGHTNRLDYLAFSPDSQRLVTTSADGTAKVWDVSSASRPRALSGYPAGIVIGAANADRSRLAAAIGKDIKMWDVKTGKELFTVTKHTGPVTCLVFSPDGKYFASGANELIVWDATTGRDLAVFGRGAPITQIAFSPDGRLLAGVLGAPVRVWEWQTGKELVNQTSKSGNEWVGWATFSPDSKRLATGRQGTHIEIWDLANNLQTQILRESTMGTAPLAFSANGRLAADGSMMDARVWDLAGGRQVRTLKGHTAKITRLAFNSDGSRLATAAADNTVRVWDAATGQELLSLPGPMGAVWSLAFSSNGEELVCASANGAIQVLDARPLPNHGR